VIDVPAAWRRARGRARPALYALLVLAAAAALTAAPTASAHPGPPSKSFDPDEVGWAAVHGHTLPDFRRTLDDHHRAGYLVVDVEADTFDGGLRLGAAFQRNTDNRGHRVEPDLTGQRFAQVSEWADAGGYRLVDLEIFELGGARHYAAAWVEDVEGTRGDDDHDLTYRQFLSYSGEQRRLGRMPVDVDVYPTADGTRYALIWIDNPGNVSWHLHGDLSGPDYLRAGRDYRDAGFRQVSFDSIDGSVDGSSAGGRGQRYGGIWLGNPNRRSWLADHDMSPGRQYDNLFHRNADLGYRQVFLGRYRSAGGVRYAALWRANTDRPGWKHRETVDRRVGALMGSTPGISVSVVQNGRTVYQRGFGHADLAGGVWMDSDHVLRTASVAKAVAGMLTLRLEEQGVLSRTDPVAGDVPGLPAQHRRTTYEQLVSNRGCVRHYANAATDPAGARADSVMAGADHPGAGAAAAMFWSQPLVAGCTVGTTESYSTHGYTIAAAGMEAAAGGTPVSLLLRRRLSDPLGLTTLRQEDPGDASVRRSKIYEGPSPAEVARDRISWKTLGGGLETTPKDLTRLGSLLLAGAVVSKARVAHMWSGTGWGYAYGFSIGAGIGPGTEKGHRRVAKNGSQRGADSFWLMYPDDGIVIAVMANRRNPGGPAPAEAIANEIGTLLLA
jgi:CubicO group peptidase (beta-lactamase class C family)